MAVITTVESGTQKLPLKPTEHRLGITAFKETFYAFINMKY